MPDHQYPPEDFPDASGSLSIIRRVCPLCGHDNAEEPATRYSYGNWEVKRCCRCEFVYIENAPNYEELFSNMAWERTTQIEHRRRSRIRPLSYKLSRYTRVRMQLFPRLKVDLLIRAHAKAGRLVDVGCGGGAAVAKLSDSFVPYGVEISTNLARSANELFESLGGRAINAPSLEGLKEFPDEFFSAASLRSYLEHELNPVPVLRELHRTLEPGGKAVVKVPNFASLNRLAMGRKWCGFRYPDHLNYFTPRTLRAMAAKCGYQTSSRFMFRLPTSDNMYAILTKA